MDSAGGVPPALGAQESGPMYELLRLYRDRDARDAKIRSLEQALAEARLTRPEALGPGPEQMNNSAIQVQQLEQSLAAHQRQLEELKTTNADHVATIDSLKRALQQQNTLELPRMTQEHALLEEKLQQMEHEFQAGVTNSKQVAALNLELETVRKSSSMMESTLSAESALVQEKGHALRQMQAKLDIITKRTATLCMQLLEANSSLQQLRGDAEGRRKNNKRPRDGSSDAAVKKPRLAPSGSKAPIVIDSSSSPSPPPSPSPHMFTAPHAYGAVRRFIADARRRLQFRMPGRAKKALTTEQVKQVDDLARELMVEAGHAEHVGLIARYRECRENGNSFYPRQEVAGPQKRKRMSVDKRMAMQGIDAGREDAGDSPRCSIRPR